MAVGPRTPLGNLLFPDVVESAVVFGFVAPSSGLYEDAVPIRGVSWDRLGRSPFEEDDLSCSTALRTSRLDCEHRSSYSYVRSSDVTSSPVSATGPDLREDGLLTGSSARCRSLASLVLPRTDSDAWMGSCVPDAILSTCC
jgi:hypothetical protein